MPVPALPPELWTKILDLAIEADPILELDLISPFAESSWFEMVFGDWWLRRPHETLRLRQRQSYFIKKAFTQTCKLFAQVGAEFMYRSILIGDPKRLRKLCSVLDRNASFARWTKAIYVYSDDRLGIRDLDVLDMGDCVVSLIHHCENLEIFVVEPQLNSVYFPAIADTLRTYCSRRLSSLQWRMTFDKQARVLPAILPFQNLVALQIELGYPSVETTSSYPGIRQITGVSFPHLVQLSLRGAIQDFSEQLVTLDVPKLKILTLDFKACCHDFPDIIEILEGFGHQLDVLDINAIPTLQVSKILLACPNLTAFCFNLDWQLEGVLVENIHEKLQSVGLYGLRHAFGVGYAGEIAQVNPFEALIMRRRNDINFSSLVKDNFPNLRRIRVLEQSLLDDLNRSNGPAQGNCYDRWERWWEQCTAQGVKLEDCTGNLLGTLPQSEEDDDDDEDYEDYESDTIERTSA